MRDIISLSAFPKSGVTYLNFLMFHCLFPDDAANLGDLEKRFVIDIHAYPQAPFAYPKGPQIIKSHYPYRPGLPFIDRTCRAIYLIRHPVDVMASAWDYGRFLCAETLPSVSFRAHARAWLESGGAAFNTFGTWVDHVRSWLGQTAIPVLLVHYEALVDRPQAELARILDFLEFDVPDELQAKAIAGSSMAAMSRLEEDEVKNLRNGVFYRQELAPGYATGRRFINKGYRDSYRKLLTDEERMLADQTFAAELAAFFSDARDGSVR